MPLLAPLLELAQPQELAPLAQVQLQVRALHLRVPRLRFELQGVVLAVSKRVPRLQILRFAVAPLANELGAQQHHVSMPPKQPGMG